MSPRVGMSVEDALLSESAPDYVMDKYYEMEAIVEAAKKWAATPGGDDDVNENALALYKLVKP